MQKAKEIAVETKAAPEATKDAGRVKIGGGAIQFSDATKDAGRVKIGGGAVNF